MFNIYSKIDIRNSKAIKENDVKGYCKKYWLNLGDKSFLFKANGDFEPNPYGEDEDFASHLDFAEVFISYLAQKANMECVNAYFAVGTIENESKNGCLIESYISQDVVEVLDLDWLCGKFLDKEYNSCFINIRGIMSILSKVADDIEIDKNIEEKLYKMCLWDYFTSQSDRNSSNIEFLIKERPNGDQYLTLAPMFDNGYSLSLMESSSQISNKLTRYYSAIKEAQTQEDINIINKRSLDKYAPTFSITNESNISNLRIDLCKGVFKYENLYKLFTFFENLNIEDELNNFSKKANYQLPDQYVEFATLMFNYKKEKIQEQLQIIYENTQAF